MTNEQEARLYELLCAYVLGEGSAEERAEVERALAGSAELRAERDRLEATIGLVKGAMSSGETLSPNATAEILSRAQRPAPRRWHVHPWMRIAASVAIFALGYATVREIRSREESDERSGSTAQRRGEEALTYATSDGNAKELPSEKKDEGLAMLDKRSNAAPESAPAVDLKNAPVIGGAEAQLLVAKAQAPRPSEPRDYFREENERDALASGISGANGPSGRSAAESAVDPLRAFRYVDSTNATTAAAESRSDSSGSTAGGAPFGGRKIGPGAPEARASDPAAAYRGPGDSVAPSSNLLPAPAAASAPQAEGSGGKLLQGLAYVGSDDRDAPKQQSEGGADDFFLAEKSGVDLEIQQLKQELRGLRPSHSKYRQTQNRIDELEQLRRLGYFGSSLDTTREPLTPERRERYIDEECTRILRSCRRRPNERPRDMFFRYWGDNAFEITQLDALSTFSVDVDTASYTLARRYIHEGNIPEKAQVRTEEFINYFKADVPAPREGTFAIHTDLAPSRFSNDAQRSMLRVVVRGREVSKQERKPLALTFVIDVSGSMKEQNRLEMVKHTLRLLLSELDANDSVAVVSFSNDARLVLPMTSVKNRGLVESALFPLQPEGSTNSEAGLRMGFEVALAGLNANATNRVVFLSDGVANVGVTDAETIVAGVKRIREAGVYLNTIGVGMNNHNDTLLEQLADKGDGVCNYVDTPEEARRSMVDNFTGAFEPIARDVKIQVEFDPAQVYRYRLLGYENRAIADKDFRNDAVDAGEIGAGHQVTALYEIERSNQVSEKPLATVRLRWKAPRAAGRPSNEEASEISQTVFASQTTSFEGAGAGYRRAVIVAQFAEFLRRSQHARGDSFDDLIAEASKLEREIQDPDFSELVILLNQSKALVLRNAPACDDICQTIDAVRRNQILRAEQELLDREQNADLLSELERQNAELEAKIRELLRKKLEQSK